MPKKDWEDIEEILNQRFKPDAKRPERLKTGIAALDQTLGGGLSPGLIILGGTPGVGKSTLALQIAANVIRTGRPVLYFSLEMQAVQILAKTICQKICESTFQDEKPASLCITADELLNGNNLDTSQWEAVESVKQALSLKQLHICTAPLSAPEIAQRVKVFATSSGMKPLVIIDYLQLVRPENGTLSDKQIMDRNLECFMRLAHIPIKEPEWDDHGNPIVDPAGVAAGRNAQSLSLPAEAFDDEDYPREEPDFAPDLSDPEIIGEIMEAEATKMALECLDNPWEENVDGIPVILISSLNRSSYSGPMTISSFKETGGIEYSADLLLGLQFRSCHNKDFDPDQEKSKSPREVELTILKNRYGSSGDAIPLQYDSAHDYFFPPEGASCKDTVSQGKGLTKPVDEDTAKSDIDASPADPSAPTAPNGPHAETHPKSFFCVINNTKVASEIRKGSTGRPCRVFKDTYVSYALSESLSSLDCCVADAIYTLAQDQKKLSLRAILQVLMGYKQANLTEQMKTELKTSIQHLRNVKFQLDCTQELRSRGILDDYTDWIYDGPFLTVEGPDENGVYQPASKEFDKGILPLYTYGAKINQMITVPAVLLDVMKPDGRRMSNTKENICLKQFLAHRLEVIRYRSLTTKKVRDQHRTISFRRGGNLLEEFRFPEPLDPYRLKQLHDSTGSILNYYKRIGYITQFKQDETDRLSSFEITSTIKSPWPKNQGANR